MHILFIKPDCLCSLNCPYFQISIASLIFHCSGTAASPDSPSKTYNLLTYGTYMTWTSSTQNIAINMRWKSHQPSKIKNGKKCFCLSSQRICQIMTYYEYKFNVAFSHIMEHGDVFILQEMSV